VWVRRFLWLSFHAGRLVPPNRRASSIEARAMVSVTSMTSSRDSAMVLPVSVVIESLITYDRSAMGSTAAVKTPARSATVVLAQALCACLAAATAASTCRLVEYPTVETTSPVSILMAGAGSTQLNAQPEPSWVGPGIASLIAPRCSGPQRHCPSVTDHLRYR